MAAEASRREALLTTGKIGIGVALSALPFLTAKPAAAQSLDGDFGILNYALTLEYLERAFYRRANGDGIDPAPDPLSVFPEDNQALFNRIQADEEAHVTLLSGAITAAGGTPVVYTDDDFTFTVGGVDAARDPALALILAQGLEDTGVRAYKGRAAEIVNRTFLQVALQIHSVEARHAAAIRRINGRQGWISNDEAEVADAIKPTYRAGNGFPAEDNTEQGGVPLTAEALGLDPALGVTQLDIAEAFDEGLDADTVLSIAGGFITGEEGDDDGGD